MSVVVNSDNPADQVYMDIPTGHEISKAVPKQQHHPKCSFRQGFMCDCSIMTACDLAVARAKDRVQEWFDAQPKSAAIQQAMQSSSPDGSAE